MDALREFDDNNGTDLQYRAQYCYRPADANCKEHERYAFQGWQDEGSFNNGDEHPNLKDLTTEIAVQDLKLFAFYDIEDAREVVSDIKLFTIIDSERVSVGNSYMTGSIVMIDEHYRDLIGGKITLPSTDNNGNPIMMVHTIKAPEVTSIYFLSSAKHTAITNSACENMAALREVYLPNSMLMLGNNSFANNALLTTVIMPDTLTTIGD
jgi:hypothetical protein